MFDKLKKYFYSKQDEVEEPIEEDLKERIRRHSKINLIEELDLLSDEFLDKLDKELLKYEIYSIFDSHIDGKAFDICQIKFMILPDYVRKFIVLDWLKQAHRLHSVFYPEHTVIDYYHYLLSQDYNTIYDFIKRVNAFISKHYGADNGYLRKEFNLGINVPNLSLKNRFRYYFDFIKNYAVDVNAYTAGNPIRTLYSLDKRYLIEKPYYDNIPDHSAKMIDLSLEYFGNCAINP